MTEVECRTRTTWNGNYESAFDYAFRREPMAGDKIILSTDEIKDTEVRHTEWVVTGRQFEQGRLVLLLEPARMHTGIVPA